MSSARVPQVLLGMGIAGIAWSAVLVIGLVAGVRLVPEAIAIPVGLVLVFPLSVIASMVLPWRGFRRGPGQASRRQLLSKLPRWALIAGAGMILAFALAGLTSHGGDAGLPEIRDGQYVLNAHNVLTVVDKATYDREIVQQERWLVSFFGASEVCIVAFGTGALLLEEDVPT
jgi:hypothetical protein